MPEEIATAPLEAEVEDPLEIEIGPDPPPVDVPLTIDRAPLPPEAPDEAEATDIAPLVVSAEVPLVNLRAPPVVPASESVPPATSEISPPAPPDALDPISNVIPPAIAPLSATPVVSEMAPVAPTVLRPVLTTKDPLAPVVPLLDVDNVTDPLVVKALCPDVSLMLPPVAAALSQVRPAFMSILPPL